MTKAESGVRATVTIGLGSAAGILVAGPYPTSGGVLKAKVEVDGVVLEGKYVAPFKKKIPLKIV